MNIDIQKTPGYNIVMGFNNQSPADAGTLFGSSSFVAASGTGLRTPITKAGTIVSASIAVAVAGTLGSSETGSAFIRLNNSSDITISTAVIYTSTAPTIITSAALSQALAVGDYIELKLTFPTFATNPTAVYVQVSVYIET